MTTLRAATVLALIPLGLLAVWVAVVMLTLIPTSGGVLAVIAIGMPFAGLLFAVAAAIFSGLSYRTHGKLCPSVVMTASVLEILIIGYLTVAMVALTQGI